MSTHFANLAAREIDRELATKHGAKVEIDGDPPFLVFVRQLGGANRRSEWRLAELGIEAGVRELEGLAAREAIEVVERELAATELVVDWEGLVDGDGVHIPFSSEAALELFARHPDVLDQVVDAARDPGRFRIDADRKSPAGRG